MTTTTEDAKSIAAARAARAASVPPPLADEPVAPVVRPLAEAQPAAEAPTAPFVQPNVPMPGYGPDGQPIPAGHVVNPAYDPNAVVPLGPDGQPIPPGHVANPNFGQPRAFNPDDPLGQVQMRGAGGKKAPWQVRVTSAPGVDPTKPQIMGNARPVQGSKGIVATGGEVARPAMTSQSQQGQGLFRIVGADERRGTGIKMSSSSPGSFARVTDGAVSTPAGATVTPVPAAPAPTVAPAAVVAQGTPAMRTTTPMTTVARVGTGVVASIETNPESPLAIMLSAHARPQRLRQQLKLLGESTMAPFDVACVANPSRFPFDEPALSTIPLVIRMSRDTSGWRRFIEAANSSAPYVAVIDDDCMPGPRWLELAVARLEQLREAGSELCVIAASGFVYQNDDTQSAALVGPESPHNEELEVDIGRGAWVCPTAVLKAFRDMQPLHPYAWATHMAAVVQMLGGLTIVLPYDQRRHGWGMLQPPTRENSLSLLLDIEAREGRGPNSAMMREQAFRCYRERGWKPITVYNAEIDAKLAAEDEKRQAAAVADGALPPQDAEEIAS